MGLEFAPLLSTKSPHSACLHSLLQLIAHLCPDSPRLLQSLELLTSSPLDAACVFKLLMKKKNTHNWHQPWIAPPLLTRENLHRIISLTDTISNMPPFRQVLKYPLVKSAVAMVTSVLFICKSKEHFMFSFLLNV